MAVYINSIAATDLTGLGFMKVTKGRETQKREWVSSGGGIGGVVALGYKSRRVKVLSFFNPNDIQPILSQALKEPVAFAGGVFAGLLRLDLNEDPLKEWVARTVEASGMTEEVIDSERFKAEEEAPQQIEIE